MARTNPSAKRGGDPLRLNRRLGRARQEEPPREEQPRDPRPWQHDGTLVRDPLEAPSPHARRVALTHVRGRGRRAD
jgi:hypothetical protein